MPPALMQRWVTWARSLWRDWKLSQELALRMGGVLAVAEFFGIPFQVTSGYRSAERQRELKRIWDSGDQAAIQAAGLVAEPAEFSRHSATDDGQPAAQAVDVASDSWAVLHRIANLFGVRTLGPDDRVHFFTV